MERSGEGTGGVFIFSPLPLLYGFSLALRRDEEKGGRSARIRFLSAFPLRVYAYLFAALAQQRNACNEDCQIARRSARASITRRADEIARYDWGVVPPALKLWHEVDVISPFLDHTIHYHIQFHI
jgi:hypothetical protein